MSKLKKFNTLCEEIIKETIEYGRIRLTDEDHKLISKLTNELRPIVQDELDGKGDYMFSIRFDDNERIIRNVESFITHNKELIDKLLIPVEDETALSKEAPQRELKKDPSIIPILKDKIKDGLKEAADADWWYESGQGERYD